MVIMPIFYSEGVKGNTGSVSLGGNQVGRGVKMNILWMGLIVLVVGVVIVKFGMGPSGAERVVVKEKIQQGALVIDVRTPSEFSAGHYPGALNIPLQDLDGRLGELGDKKRAIVVYCASGMRSAQAAKLLTAANFADVTNAGGLSSLEQAVLK
jgi:phage shock protein E